MKKLLTLLLLCFISTITFANKGFATKNNLNFSNNETKVIKGTITLTQNFEITNDEKQASCTATVTTAVYIDGVFFRNFTATRTVTLETANGTCAFALGEAQYAVNAAIEEYANNNGLVNSYD